MGHDIVGALTEALADAHDWSTVASSLRQADADGPLAPMMESAFGVYPAPLRQLPAEAMVAWSDVIEAIDSPLPRSRYGDLLWLCRFGDEPHGYARLAPT